MTESNKDRLFIYLDENDYRKKKTALRHYFKRAHTYLKLDVYPKLKERGKKDGKYSLKLPTDWLFKKTYGQLELLFSVKNDTAVIEDLQPASFLLDAYYRDLDLYKGVPYRNEKDLFKLKTMEKLKKEEDKNEKEKDR